MRTCDRDRNQNFNMGYRLSHTGSMRCDLPKFLSFVDISTSTWRLAGESVEKQNNRKTTHFVPVKKLGQERHLVCDGRGARLRGTEGPETTGTHTRHQDTTRERFEEREQELIGSLGSRSLQRDV